jgi:hypothetical protein
MAFAQAGIEFLSELRIRKPTDFDKGLANLISLMKLEEGNDLNDLIARGWRKFLDLDNSISGQESLEKICLLGAFHSMTASDTAVIQAAFSKERLNFSRSRLEMSLRLASRLYMLGRKAKFGTEGLADAIKILFAAVRFFDEAVQQQGRLNPPTLRRLFGMRGVAHLLIARTGDSSLPRLKQAASDLDQSHKLGDQTPQNLVYRRECALRLYEIERKIDHLDQLKEMFEEGGTVIRTVFLVQQLS